MNQQSPEPEHRLDEAAKQIQLFIDEAVVEDADHICRLQDCAAGVDSVLKERRMANAAEFDVFVEGDKVVML